MIVKFKTLDDGWNYIPVVKNVRVRTLTNEQFKFGIENLETPNFIEIDATKPLYITCDPIKVKCININGTIIYTTEKVYLLNDEGKTIERLN